MREMIGLRWAVSLTAVFFHWVLLAEPLHSAPMAVQTVAVWDFENNSVASLSSISHADYLTRVIPEMILARLQGEPGLKLVERVHLRAILEEQKLGSSALVDQDSRLRLGRMLGAQRMVFGQFMILGPTIRMDARMVEVETALTVAAESVSGPVGKVTEMGETLARKLALDMTGRILKSDVSGSASQSTVWEGYDAGIKMIDQGKYEEALTAFTALLKKHPDFQPAERQIGLIAERMARQ